MPSISAQVIRVYNVYKSLPPLVQIILGTCRVPEEFNTFLSSQKLYISLQGYQTPFINKVFTTGFTLMSHKHGGKGSQFD